jgi:hypothetical protein
MKKDQSFVMFHGQTTCKGNFVFQSLFVFSLGWRVGLTILNCHKTDKNKKWLNRKKISQFGSQILRFANFNS